MVLSVVPFCWVRAESQHVGLTQIRVSRAFHLCLLRSGNIQPSSSRTRSYIFPLRMVLFPRLSLSPLPTFWSPSLHHCYGSSLSFSFCHYWFFSYNLIIFPIPQLLLDPSHLLFNSFQGRPPLTGRRENQNKQKPNKTKKKSKPKSSHTQKIMESLLCWQ